MHVANLLLILLTMACAACGSTKQVRRTGDAVTTKGPTRSSEKADMFDHRTLDEDFPDPEDYYYGSEEEKVVPRENSRDQAEPDMYYFDNDHQTWETAGRGEVRQQTEERTRDRVRGVSEDARKGKREWARERKRTREQQGDRGKGRDDDDNDDDDDDDEHDDDDDEEYGEEGGERRGAKQRRRRGTGEKRERKRKRDHGPRSKRGARAATMLDDGTIIGPDYRPLSRSKRSRRESRRNEGISSRRTLRKREESSESTSSSSSELEVVKAKRIKTSHGKRKVYTLRVK